MSTVAKKKLGVPGCVASAAAPPLVPPVTTPFMLTSMLSRHSQLAAPGLLAGSVPWQKPMVGLGEGSELSSTIGAIGVAVPVTW